MKKPVQNLLEDNEETHYSIVSEAQIDRIEQTISHQKSLLSSSYSSLSYLSSYMGSSLYSSFSSSDIVGIDATHSLKDEGSEGLLPSAAAKMLQPTEDGSELDGHGNFASDSIYPRTVSKRRLMRTRSFRTLPRFGAWRWKGYGFKWSLRPLQITICGHKF